MKLENEVNDSRRQGQTSVVLTGNLSDYKVITTSTIGETQPNKWQGHIPRFRSHQSSVPFVCIEDTQITTITGANIELQRHIQDDYFSTNAHLVIALIFSQIGTDVLPRSVEGSKYTSATIESHGIMVPTRSWTRAGGLKFQRRNHHTKRYTATHICPQLFTCAETYT